MSDRQPLLDPDDPLNSPPKQQPSSSPPKHRRRNTFTRPLHSSPHNLQLPQAVFTSDSPHAYDSRDTSRANSISSTGGFRDLRSFDPAGLATKRRGSSFPRRASTASELSSGSGRPLMQNASPSFAERWVQKQGHYGSLGRTGEVRIDMDAFARANHGSSGSHHDDEDEPGSKPSTRRNSDASSLDDVCFPLDGLDDVQGLKNWPDLAVLEEFHAEETQRLEEDAKREAQELNAKFDQASDISNETGHAVGFSYPIVTKIDTSASLSQPSPALSQTLLANQKINETETLNGRLRPPKINPFDKKRYNSNSEFLKTINYPSHIINSNPEHFRFTYFREDLDSTIHSPTISGLLQPGQKFADLFSWKDYFKQQPSVPQSTSEASATLREATPAISEAKTDSVSEEVPPFWLDVLNPTEEEIKVLSKAFSIHPLTTEDIFLGETREKVELFKDYYFVCFRSFDIVQERRKQSRRKSSSTTETTQPHHFWKLFGHQSTRGAASSAHSQTSTQRRQNRKLEREKYQRKSGEKRIPKKDELEPLNVYIVVFRHAVITFHFAPTPHPINVRRRARLLREYLTVSADWIAYALIDDITDAFGPMIESIEDEVNDIEDAILRMHPGKDSSSEEESDDDDDVEFASRSTMRLRKGSVLLDNRSVKSMSSASTRSTASNVIEWKRKGDLLKRIGESRKRVMSLLRLLGSKVDVIKGFAKRCNEQWEVAPRSEIGMYLGDIQDHIVTMVQSLNHYEKLLARSHSNYLAQINIDMTKVNNDTNDVLGKISLLGTVVLPMNIVTGLWGMNVLVPGQDYDGLLWFWGIAAGMFIFATGCYVYMKRISGLT